MFLGKYPRWQLHIQEFLLFLQCDLGLPGEVLAEAILGGLINFVMTSEIMVDKPMMELQQFLDILMGYLHTFVKLTVKRYIHNAIVTTLI